MTAATHRGDRLSILVQTCKSIHSISTLIATLVFLIILPPCSAIPTCSPSDEIVESGTVDVIEMISSHTYTFRGDASTIGWHLKIPNPESGKLFEYYPIMLLSVWEKRPGEREYHHIRTSPESCMEPSVYIENPVKGAQYRVQVICAIGLVVDYELYAMTYHCDTKPSSKKTPSWLSDRIRFVQNSLFSEQNTENLYRNLKKAKKYVETLSTYFDRDLSPPGGTDCLDRAVYLFAAAKKAGMTSSVVIWGPKKKGESGHANVIINGKLFDSTSNIRDVSFFYDHYELIGVADSYEKIAFYLDPSVW